MLPVQPLDKGSALPETIAGTAPLSGTIAATEDASRRGEGNEKDLDLELGAGASAGGGRGAAEDNGEGRHSLSRAVSGPRPEEGESEVDGEMRPRLPTSRIVLLAIMMLMTFFIGVSSFFSRASLICQRLMRGSKESNDLGADNPLNRRHRVVQSLSSFLLSHEH